MTTLQDMSGKSVLVTGGTGFVGSRLVERLVLQHAAEVKVMARNLSGAMRVARYGVEMIPGDITDPADVRRAAQGCEFIFHCAYGNKGDEEQRRKVTVEGTRNVLEAGLHARVRRVIHVSTVAVYGWATPDGVLDETAERKYVKNVYSDTKLDAENLVLDYVHNKGLSAVILQPGVIYGPYAVPWTVSVLDWLKTGNTILVDGGDGVCNVVYIDDLVDALLLAAVSERASGETFLVSGAEPVTWKQFYSRFEGMLGMPATVCMSATEAKRFSSARGRSKGIFREMLSILMEEPQVRKRILRTPALSALKRAAEAVLPEQSQKALKARMRARSKQKSAEQSSSDKAQKIHALPDFMIDLYASKTRMSIDKAKRILGYSPAYDFRRGMELTEQWAKWANLV